MKSIFLAAALAATMSAAVADEWTGKDKTQHAIVGAVVGASTTLASGEWKYGCAAAAGIGAAKEIYDNQHRDRHTASLKDFIVTAAAGCLAAKGTALIIAPKANGVHVSYTWIF